MPFRTVITAQRTTSGSTFTALDLTAANLGNRANDVKDDFEFFRIAKLHMYSSVDALTVGSTTAALGGVVLHGVAFDNAASPDTGAIASLGVLSQLQHFKVGPAFQQPRLAIPKGDLWRGGPNMWFHTTATGTPNSDTLSAGTAYAYLVAGSTGTFFGISQYVIVEGVIQFHTPVDLSVSKVRIPRNKLEDPAVSKAVARLKEALDT